MHGGRESLFVSDRAVVERFLAAPDLSEATRRAYRVDVEEFTSWLRAREKSLTAVDAAILSAYIAELGASRPGRRPRAGAWRRHDGGGAGGGAGA